MDLAPLIEHTLLSADATGEEVDRLCADAMRAGLLGVCVNPLFVPRCRSRIGTARTRLITVVGFPLGATASEMKAAEAQWAVRAGADEIDMVIPIGLAKAGEFRAVEADVSVVRDAVRSSVLKVILETGSLTPAQVEAAAHAAVRAGADYLKTSTGFGPRGASVEDVQLLLKCCTSSVGVKASGGIRTREDALRLVTAGATRIGTSRGVALVSESH